jgi:hypothetical protein
MFSQVSRQEYLVALVTISEMKILLLLEVFVSAADSNDEFVCLCECFLSLLPSLIYSANRNRPKRITYELSLPYTNPVLRDHKRDPEQIKYKVKGSPAR